ncbi:response regulator transcription factor [Draconibacterium halophilum]|uniref:Response regulator transcription factor n=1 Tax=Draconibacterium halophilum TaxID=2706887 RepID=A0A6C0RG34_9BACT|nr:response regulator transcription factor [Draconibacterium halophilum]QIA09099.1 response regulator transcription factor [Draconibacterium halophilum]
MEKTTITIVDDHKIFRDGLILLLRNFDFVSVVGQAANGQEFLGLIENEAPDIVFMDINMPKMNGIEATKQALQKYPDIKVIALTSFADDEYIEQMISAGVEGYMLKRSNIEDFEKAIKKVADGGSYFSSEIIKVISRNLYKDKERKLGEQLLSNLTSREKEILNLICKGLNNEQIAELINLSPKTVEKHKSNLFQKTATFNTVNLVIYAFKNQLISL